MEIEVTAMIPLTRVSFKNLSCINKTLFHLPRYKKSLLPQVVCAVLLSSTSFTGSANSVLSGASQSTFSLSSTAILFKAFLLSHSLDIALLVSIEKSMETMREDVKNAGLQNLEKKFKQHVKAYEQQELAKRLARDEARFEAMAASMAQYAQLNDKAYELGKSTHIVLQHIEQKLTVPIYATEAFKAGMAAGKAGYNMAAMERGVDLNILLDKKPVTVEDGLIKADSGVSKNEIKPSLEQQ